MWAPLGNTWYDSLQIKATKRYSHGLDFTYAFTWSKKLDTLSKMVTMPNVVIQDVQDRPSAKSLSANSRPFISGLGMNYTVPKWGTNKALSLALRDWTIGAFLLSFARKDDAPPSTSRPADRGTRPIVRQEQR